ncbi:hypothetical protein [Anaerostipes sp.]|uniref:hypothetical protein n=1 Tax=Anaerostipes sp. TaxID=1872530 RepID=UPI0025BC6C34|nr:hypothetical protein [Anaerostipes sp.]MBS7009570.1 hypothetical protein [Anaerostipes sp.]
MQKEKCSIELYVNKKYLFPNNYLEEARSNTLLDENEYDIYFILLGDSYKIKGIYEDERLLHIIVVNITDNNKYLIDVDVLESFRVPYCSCLEIKLADEGAILNIEYNDKGIEYLKKYCPKEYYVYMDRIEKEGYFHVSMHAKFLVEMLMESNKQEHVEQYDILYIGQTKQDDIFNRLNSHHTLQRIMRETYRSNSQKELYIIILSIATKHIETSILPDFNTYFYLSNTLAKGFELNALKKDAMINMAEALFISYFQPKYNKRLKSREGREKLNTYRKIDNAEINPIILTFDLFYEDTKKKLILKTDLETTRNKVLMIECAFKKDSLSVTCIDFPDAFY